jgi:hypothetical protein
MTISQWPNSSATDRLAQSAMSFWLNRHRALELSMICAQTGLAFVARENRCTLFRIML